MGVDIRRVGYGHPDAWQLIEAVQAEYVERYGEPDATPLERAMFEPPVGSFFVGYVEDVPALSGAWRATSVASIPGRPGLRLAEIKRMYVAAGHRGSGLARLMLAHLETTAAEAGYEALVLETGRRQPEAIGLYESSGYEPIEGFGHYRDDPLSVYFGRVLDVQPST